MPESRNPQSVDRGEYRRQTGGGYERSDGTVAKRISLHLPPDLVREVKVAAAAAGVSPSDFVAGRLRQNH